MGFAPGKTAYAGIPPRFQDMTPMWATQDIPLIASGGYPGNDICGSRSTRRTHVHDELELQALAIRMFLFAPMKNTG
jgi:hypothetical protein